MSTEPSNTTDPTDDQGTETVAAHDAHAAHEADRPPTPDEERVAEQVAEDTPATVADHYEEMSEIGANVRGEGAISPD